MKKYWKQIVILTIIPFGFEMLWSLYNTYVPIYLQSGNPAFDVQKVSTTLGFGLGATFTGFIMTLDNIAALILGPLVGMWSDRLKSRWGKRLPFILFGIPVAALGFALLPVGPMLISVENNGNFSQLAGVFTLFIISALAVVAGWSVNNTIVSAMRWDIIPSEFRSKANGIMSVVAALGGIVALVIGAGLYKIYRPLPFWITAGIVLVGAILWVAYLKPDKNAKAETTDSAVGIKDLFNGIKVLPKEHGRSLIFLILATLSTFIGIAILQAFFTSYGVSVMKMEEAKVSNLFAILFLAFLVFAVPAGFLAGRFGRKRMVIIGLAVMTLCSFVVLFMQQTTITIVALVIMGMSYAIIQVNVPVMFVDTPPDDRSIGTYTGIGLLSLMLGYVLGPILGGALVEATGTNYNNIWVIQPAVYVIAMLLMTQVTKGEARKVKTSSDVS